MTVTEERADTDDPSGVLVDLNEARQRRQKASSAPRPGVWLEPEHLPAVRAFLRSALAAVEAMSDEGAS